MTRFDVFNGDADGLCALHQLRLAEPADAVLVTGVKRDIALLPRVAAAAVAGDVATVLDISLAANRDALDTLLAGGVAVRYFDHHYAGDVPAHPLLQAAIDPAPDVCTSIVVDRHLDGRHRVWAVVGAFGDNLAGPARQLAAALALDEGRIAALQALGDNLAYNAYGDTEADLVIGPADLYRVLSAYADPWKFIADEPVLKRIEHARHHDLLQARDVDPALAADRATLYLLPDEPWSRRVRGAFGNELANRHPDVAHAILTPNEDGGCMVSVRAPLAAPRGADALCRAFSSGGGRAGAAGINHLPTAEIPEFFRRFAQTYP
ncbi:MAG: acetyltransferase [Betaproteobacteria bacterium]